MIFNTSVGDILFYGGLGIVFICAASSLIKISAAQIAGIPIGGILALLSKLFEWSISKKYIIIISFEFIT